MTAARDNPHSFPLNANKQFSKEVEENRIYVRKVCETVAFMHDNELL